MVTIASFEVEKNLSALLERVQHGEHFVITEHGAPVAQLVPVEPRPDRQRVAEIIAQIRKAREERPHVGRQEIREMIEEGRR